MLNWTNMHPWMTFILGMLSLLTFNTFFVSIGGGYKKFPPAIQQTEDEDDDILHD